MIYISGWDEVHTYTISDLKVGTIFTEVEQLFVKSNSKVPNGVYLYLGHNGTNAAKGSAAEHVPHRALDLLELEKGSDTTPIMRFSECFVRKGIATKEGTAMVAGLLASGV